MNVFFTSLWHIFFFSTDLNQISLFNATQFQLFCLQWITVDNTTKQANTRPRCCVHVYLVLKECTSCSALWGSYHRLRHSCVHFLNAAFLTEWYSPPNKQGHGIPSREKEPVVKSVLKSRSVCLSWVRTWVQFPQMLYQKAECGSIYL